MSTQFAGMVHSDGRMGQRTLQELEAAGPIASAVREANADCWPILSLPSSLPLFYSVHDPIPEKMPPTFRVDLPISITPCRNSPSHAQSSVSGMMLDLTKLIISIFILKIILQMWEWSLRVASSRLNIALGCQIS